MMAAASSSRLVSGLGRLSQRIPSRSLVACPHHQQSQRRSLHTLPPLPNGLQGERGCRPLFQPPTLNVLWKEWQGGLLSRLNEEVAGTQWENASIAETVIGTAKDPEMIQAFNYASLALNHAFFLSNLKEKSMPAGSKFYDDTAPPKPPSQLLDMLESQFESLAAFKLAFSSMAFGMAGSGFVWLVRDRDNKLGIVPTYAAGTLLVQNRMQTWGMGDALFQASIVESSTPTYKTPSTPSPSAGSPSRFNTTRGMSTSATTSASSSYRIGGSHLEGVEGRGEELYPLFCISVHERDWISDYGLWGKEEYLTTFWESIDWIKVFRLWESYKGI